MVKFSICLFKVNIITLRCIHAMACAHSSFLIFFNRGVIFYCMDNLKLIM